jgi:3-hydroxybutyryl-CoA dehydrogenase
MKKLSDIKKVLILGSGTLGLRVGLVCALNGYTVTIFDISQNALEKASKSQDRILAGLVREKRIDQTDVDKVKQAISWTTNDLEAVADADLINESVTEDRALKEKVWKRFGEICPEKTIFTTNTSYLLPSMFAEISGRPVVFCALHFHDVFYANVVDIMPHPGTAPELIPLLTEFGKSIDQVPVVMEKESHGYIFNSMLMALLGAAGALVTYNITNIENVDRSWMGNFKMHMGPFGILDDVGLDTAWHIVKEQKDERSRKFAILLSSYIDQGKLGVKSGEGFYKYPNPKYKDPDFLMG